MTANPLSLDNAVARATGDIQAIRAIRTVFRELVKGFRLMTPTAHRISVRVASGGFDAHSIVQQAMVCEVLTDHERGVLGTRPVGVVNMSAFRKRMSQGPLGAQAVYLESHAVHGGRAIGCEIRRRLSRPTPRRNQLQLVTVQKPPWLSLNIACCRMVLRGKPCRLPAAALTQAERDRADRLDCSHAGPPPVRRGLVRSAAMFHASLRSAYCSGATQFNIHAASRSFNYVAS